MSEETYFQSGVATTASAGSEYSLVPKERHVRKESKGSTLGLCVVPNESHDSTLVKQLSPKESLFFSCGQRPPYIIVPHTIFNTL